MTFAAGIPGVPADERLQYLLALALAVPTAVLVGIGQPVLALIVVAGVLLPLFLGAMLRADRLGRRDIAFWIFPVLLLAISLYRRTFGNTLFGFAVTGFMELTLLILTPFVLPAFWGWIRESLLAQVLVFLVVAFLAIGVLSSLFGKTHSIPGALYQGLSNLKFVIMLAVGFFIPWTERTEKNFWLLVRWAWLPLTVLVLWRWVSPSTYILSPALYGQPAWMDHPEAHWLGLPSKSPGPFVHPLYMAGVSCAFMLFAIIKGTTRGHRSFLLVALCYFWLEVASGQKGEFITVLTAIPIVLGAIMGRRYFVPMAFVAVVGVIVATWWAWNSQFLTHVLRSWAITGDRTDIHDISSTYGVMYWHAYYIANQFWPLGSGLSTFGGVGAAKFDTSYYLDRGFGTYWWWDERNVLTDTLWPCFIAENGWIGGLLMALILLGLLAYSCNRALNETDPRARMYWLMTFAAQLFNGGDSPESAVYQNPGLFFVAIVFFGIAYNLSRRARADARAAERPPNALATSASVLPRPT